MATQDVRVVLGVGGAIGGAMWIGGWILAKGFWSTLVAVIFPPWGWYIVVEKVLIMNGMIT